MGAAIVFIIVFTIVVIIVYILCVILYTYFRDLGPLYKESLGQRLSSAMLTPGRIILYENGLHISNLIYNQDIPYSEIVKIESKSITIDKIKDKSVIGRAAVGNLFFGQTGAVIGAMSALKEEKTKKCVCSMRIHTKEKIFFINPADGVDVHNLENIINEYLVNCE